MRNGSLLTVVFSEVPNTFQKRIDHTFEYVSSLPYIPYNLDSLLRHNLGTTFLLLAKLL